MIASTPGDASKLLKAFGQANYSPPGILAVGAGFGPSTVLGAGPDGEALLSGTAWSREIAGRSAIAKPVMDLYEERFNQPMSETAAGTFTAVLVLAEAIDNAGSTDPQRVRAALLNLDIPGRELIMPWSGLRFDGLPPERGRQRCGRAAGRSGVPRGLPRRAPAGRAGVAAAGRGLLS